MRSGKLTEEQTRLVEENVKLAPYLYHKLGKSRAAISLADDLISEGYVGLVKAAKSFEQTKGIKFTTYASRCITNEMLMFLRKQKKHESVLSLDAPVCTDGEGNESTLADVIEEKRDYLQEFINAESAKENCARFFDGLNGRDKKIVALRLEGLKQRGVAERTGYGQSCVSRLLRKMKKRYKEIIEKSAV